MPLVKCDNCGRSYNLGNDQCGKVKCKCGTVLGPKVPEKKGEEMMDSYFVFVGGGDCGVSMDGPLTKDQLTRKLVSYMSDEVKVTFLSAIPPMDKGNWELGDGPLPIMVIKGEIVVPKPVEVITEYEIP